MDTIFVDALVITVLSGFQRRISSGEGGEGGVVLSVGLLVKR